VVHISYYSTEGELRYARLPAGAAEWRLEAIDWPGGFGQSIGVDGNGGVHVAYSRWAEFGLAYARREDRPEWDIRILVSAADGGYPGQTPSLVLDERGNVHIAHHDFNLPEVYYTFVSADRSDVRTEIAGQLRQASGTSIARDTTGALHVLSDALHAYRDVGSWRTEELAPLELSEEEALGADPVDGLHLAFTIQGLGYARGRRQNGSWLWQAERPDVSDCTAPAIAVDADGVAHVVCAGEHGVRHAYRTPDGRWWTESIDPRGATPGSKSASIVAGACGTLHAAFATSNGDVMYAHRCTAAVGESVTVESGWFTSDHCEVPGARIGCGMSSCECPQACCGDESGFACTYACSKSVAACDGKEDCQGDCCVWAGLDQYYRRWFVSASCAAPDSTCETFSAGEALAARACHTHADCAAVFGSDGAPYRNCCAISSFEPVALCMQDADCVGR
jgi:hypothetical protein